MCMTSRSFGGKKNKDTSQNPVARAGLFPIIRVDVGYTVGGLREKMDQKKMEGMASSQEDGLKDQTASMVGKRLMSEERKL